MATQAARSHGFQNAVSHLEYFLEMYAFSSDVKETIKPTFRATEIALKEKYLSEEDIKKLKEIKYERWKSDGYRNAFRGQLSGGEVMAPNNLGTIMQDMFSQMVSPEQMPTNGQPPVQKPVTLTQSVADPVKIESQVSSPQNPPTDANANANADLNLFTDEPAVEPRQEAAEDDEPDMSDVPEERTLLLRTLKRREKP